MSIGNPTSGELTTITDNDFTDLGTEFNIGGVSAAVSFGMGGTGNVALNGTINIISEGGSNTIYGTEGPDVITGGNGNDVIHAGPNDIVNGGAGTNTVVLPDGLTPAELASTSLNNVGKVVFESSPAGTFHVLAGISIQAAVNAASDGDTIIIGAGTFTENVSLVGKNGLTIKGAQAGVSAGVGGTRDADSTMGETILVGCGDATQVTGLTLDGLRMEGATGMNAIRIKGALKIENTIIDVPLPPAGADWALQTLGTGSGHSIEVVDSSN